MARNRIGIAGACVAAVVLLCSSLQAQTYVYNTKGIYQKVVTYKEYYKYGRKLYKQYVEYKLVLPAPAQPEPKKYSDWRTGGTELLKQIEDNNAFLKFADAIGAKNVMNQPLGNAGRGVGFRGFSSAQGSTLGGFSQIDYSRFGEQAFDLNARDERIALRIDQQQRLAGQGQEYARDNVQDTAALINALGVQTGAIGEIRELRAALRDIASGQAEQFKGQAEVLQKLRASPVETLRERSGVIPPQNKDNSDVPETPQSGGVEAARAALAVRSFEYYCAKCHSGAKPEKRLTLPPEEITLLQKGKLLIALDPNSPDDVRMPPASEEQPSAEDRQLMIDYVSSLE